MATPKIGAISFAVMTGRVGVAGQALSDISRDGYDGSEEKQVGERGVPAQLRTTRDFDSASDAAAHLSACASIQGTIVTVEYADGTTLSNCIVLQVLPEPVQKATAAVGGVTDGEWVAHVNWLVKHRGT